MKKILILLLSCIILFWITGCKNKEKDIKIRNIETKQIKYTDFDNGLIKMKIPEGWKVDVLGDYIHYTIKAYN